jgi:hypothetical protein
MKRIILLLALAGCAFARKHPGITVGIATGSVGFFSCEIAVDKVGTCAAIGAVTGVILGGITGLFAILGADHAHQILTPEEEEAERRRLETTSEPPPGLPVDAGVPLAPIDAGAADAAPADAAI